jgi:hypothetical protein
MAFSGLIGRNDWRDRDEIQAELGQRRTEHLADRVNELEERVDHLALLSVALWQLLSESTGWSEEELIKRVTELDLRDGKIDGRVTGNAIDCPECHRPVARRHRRCLYCEHELGESGAFGNVVR